MATVKGDVHDIGKNIVGVVLQCNNYEVIDLGVMVPATKILETAKKEGADIIGLSGLITPSLDEMCHVAAEMEREGFALPLLIGGATTSRVHTAVKIHPNYRRGQTVYVTDASRAVGVVSQLMSKQAQGPFVSDVRAEYAKIAAAHARGEENKRRLSLADARKNALRFDWSAYRPTRPRFTGTRIFDNYPVAELIDYIDWSPFFSTWELTGKFPAILDDEKFGEAARSLYDDATAMLKKIVDENWFKAAAIVGFWPAQSQGDDILVGDDDVLAHAAPAARAARGPRQCGARGFHRAEGFRRAGLHRRVRGHRRHRRGRDRGSLQACERRLLVDHGQGAGGSPRRGFRGAHAPARAQGVLGLRG